MTSAYVSVAMEERSSTSRPVPSSPTASPASGPSIQSAITSTAPLSRLVPKTSISHPINISWIVPSQYLPLLSYCELPDDIDLYDLTDPLLERRLAPHLAEAQKAADCSAIRPIGNLALSSCPGKKVRLTGPSRGRAAIDRELDLDFSRMQSFGITTVVCCLNDAELDYLGAPWPKYSEAAARAGMDVIRVPMIEGSCPDTLEEIDTAIEAVNVKIQRGENVLTHCRGGVGRAGLFACCWLLKNLYCLSAERAIRYVRIRRSPKAIETMRQAEYVIHYSQYVGRMLEEQHMSQEPIPIDDKFTELSILSTSSTTTNATKISISALPKPLLMSHTDYRLTIPSLSDISRLEQSMRDTDKDI